MNIGEKCKTDFDDKIYRVIDKRIVKTDTSTKYEIKINYENFVDLQEEDNPENILKNISDYKIHPIT